MEEDKIKYKKFLQGDNQSLEELMKKYKVNLLFFITRYVKNKEIAEDIYQDVIIYFLEIKKNTISNIVLKHIYIQLQNQEH